MEILRKLKSEFDKLNKRGRAIVIIGIAIAVFFILELVK